MSCHEIQEMLSAYVDDELTKKEFSLVSDHLDNCSECFELYQDLKTISGLFIDIEEQSPPSSIRSNVMKEVANEKTEKESSKVYRMTWHLRRVAAGLVLFFISLGIGIYPLIAHNLAVESPLELLQKVDDRADDVGIRSYEIEAPGKLEEGIKEDPESDSMGIASIEDEQPEQEDEPLLGIMEVESDVEEKIGESEELGSEDQLIMSGEFTDDSLSEEKSIIDIVGTPNLVFSFAGVFFGVLMIWYAKPQRK